ncbi:phosphocarrier protein HPr [Bacillaceae bacterium SIJ1]|uniref:phosphocarrier protein HPr n=1 Tax=Litoribacterium kuwaitense TaxID=1398745 RepID=UPI0013ED5E38|nr:phosphocarrier protein HPr [Litoribacterium kuwaitense]NGP46621.1 phosphocarrier protein HPr [Litoribacterium kuwaitense]
MIEKAFNITNETGLHARPATQLVNKAGQFQADINLSYKDKSVNLKSIMGVMSLGVPKGASVTISIDGRDEEEAMAGITEAITVELGEEA